MVEAIPYQLDPNAYVADMVRKGGSLSGLLEAWRSGAILWEPDYLTDVVIAWVKVLPSD